MRELRTESIPIRVWGDDVDEQTIAQTRNLANLPFAFDHIALMPDAHVGYGMPIGGVLATVGEIIPHAVGLDIGCGVCAWNTGVPGGEFRPVRKGVLAAIQRDVPTGFDWHDASQAELTDLFGDVPDVGRLRAEIERAERQVGTLGGGNHFIEFQLDPDDRVWGMLHSGSRNLGKQMAEHYDEIARRECARGRSPVPEAWGLAHLAIDSDAGREYLAVMDFCLRFAKENRRLMREAVQRVVERVIGADRSGLSGADLSESAGDGRLDRAAGPIDVHHNYAAVEEHFGERVVVHRKGAVRAVGTVVIPGSMGTTSFLGRGLDNADSFASCSHGAGRAMSRRAARKRFAVREVYAEMRDRGVELAAGRKGDVAEEVPAAYKDIEQVMAWQADLVEPIVRLEPLAVVKA